jgi:hypothetical protein
MPFADRLQIPFIPLSKGVARISQTFRETLSRFLSCSIFYPDKQSRRLECDAPLGRFETSI